MGIQAFPNLAGQSMRPELRIVRKAESIVSLNVADVCTDDPESFYYEDKLGCARGIRHCVVLEARPVLEHQQARIALMVARLKSLSP
jgi:hypothetical protein